MFPDRHGGRGHPRGEVRRSSDRQRKARSDHAPVARGVLSTDSLVTDLVAWHPEEKTTMAYRMRPASVTTIAILQIIFGSLGLLCSIGGAAMKASTNTTT